MSREIGCFVPGPVAAHCSSTSPDRIALPLIGVDDKGRPHVALLSYFELAVEAGNLHFWLDESSRSATFLRRHPGCTLLVASQEGIYYLKGRARPADRIEGQAVFRLELEEVLEDLPTRAEGETAVLSGTRFRLPEDVARQKLDLKERVLRTVARDAL